MLLASYFPARDARSLPISQPEGCPVPSHPTARGMLGIPGPFRSHSLRNARDPRDPRSLPIPQYGECPGSPGCPVPSHLTARGIAAGAAPVPRAWPGCSSPGSNSGPAAAQGFKDRIRGSASAVQQEQPGFDVFRDRGRSTHSEELF